MITSCQIYIICELLGLLKRDKYLLGVGGFGVVLWWLKKNAVVVVALE